MNTSSIKCGFSTENLPELKQLFNDQEEVYGRIVKAFHDTILTSVGKGMGYFVYTNFDRVVLYHIKSIIKIEERNILVCLEKIEIWKNSFGKEYGMVYSSFSTEPLYSLLNAVSEKEDEERAFGDNLSKELFEEYKNKALRGEILDGTFEDIHGRFWKIASESGGYKKFVELIGEWNRLEECISFKKRENYAKTQEEDRELASEKLSEIINQQAIGKFVHIKKNCGWLSCDEEIYGIVEKVSLSYYRQNLDFFLSKAVNFIRWDENCRQIKFFKKCELTYGKEDSFEFISQEEYDEVVEATIRESKSYIEK